jgi:V8-like Glu-specific endopeptidase
MNASITASHFLYTIPGMRVELITIRPGWKGKKTKNVDFSGIPAQHLPGSAGGVSVSFLYRAAHNRNEHKA